MTKQRNRVNLTLSDEMFDTLTELSELSDTPRAALISELLDDVKPHLQKSIELIKMLKQEKITMAEARGFYIDMVADVTDVTADALREINKPIDREIREAKERNQRREKENATDNGKGD